MLVSRLQGAREEAAELLEQAEELRRLVLVDRVVELVHRRRRLEALQEDGLLALQRHVPRVT